MDLNKLVHNDSLIIVYFCTLLIPSDINALLSKQLNYGCFATFILISELMAKLP